MSNQLSVVIITNNEENFIEDAIKSALFADEVIVLDSFSVDKTCEIAASLGARVIQNDWQGYGKQKNFAINLALNNWVFVLDSDERISLKLQNEIIGILKNPDYDGYRVPRLNWFFGKAIKTCGLYPDFSIRLFDKRCGEFNEVPVHESVQIRGRVSNLKNHMIHLAYENVEEFIIKQKKYSKLSYKKKNKLKAFISPMWVFIKIYFIKLGFLDGRHGFVIATVYAQYTYWKYSKKFP